MQTRRLTASSEGLNSALA